LELVVNPNGRDLLQRHLRSPRGDLPRTPVPIEATTAHNPYLILSP
jgi:hypothetical protein